MQKKSSSDQEIVVEISENDSRVDTQALNEEKCEKKMKMDGRDYETKQKILVRLAYCSVILSRITNYLNQNPFRFGDFATDWELSLIHIFMPHVSLSYLLYQ